MLLTVGNLKTRIASATDAEREWLAEYLSFPDKSWAARRIAQEGDDPRVSMMDLERETFPTGFLPLVQGAGVKGGFQVDVLDKRVRPCEPDPNADLEWLRHHPATPEPITYQIEALDAIERTGRGLLKLPTGAGKGELVAGLWKKFPCRWLFLVHRTTLVAQTAARFTKRTGVIPGTIGDGVWNPDLSPRGMTFSTFQSLASAIRSGNPEATRVLEAAQAVVGDEVHVVPSQSFLGVMNRTPNAYWRVGLSGTPLARGDSKSIWAIGTIGPIVYTVKADTLINLGVLARPTVRYVNCEQFSSVVHTGDWRGRTTAWGKVYRELVVQSKKRNALLVDIVQRAAKPSIVFVKEIAHGKALAAALARAGVAAEFTWGDKSTESREATLERLRRRDIDVCIASVVFREGMDFPELASMVNGAAGSSVIAAVQGAGRALRATADKTTAEIWDIADSGEKTLTKHARVRRNAYLKEGYSVLEGMP